MNTEQTKTKHKRYDEAFKKSAVEHWLISGKSARQVASNLTSLSDSTSFTDANATGLKQSFYRVRVEQ